MIKVHFGGDSKTFELSGLKCKSVIESLTSPLSLQPKILQYPQRYFSLKVVSQDQAQELLVEDTQDLDTLAHYEAGGKYFFRVEEDPAKYEFLRRSQMIFKKELVQLPAHYNSNNRRFEENLESYFRDHRRIDFSDANREIRISQELKWATDSTSLLKGFCQSFTRKFQKAHFQLRSDGQQGAVLMYSPTKQQQHLDDALTSIGYYVLAVLSDCDIFTAIPEKKKQGGFLIMFKPKTKQEAENKGEIKYLLVESRSDLNCWMSVLRLAKFGESLRASYDHRVSRPRIVSRHQGNEKKGYIPQTTESSRMTASQSYHEVSSPSLSTEVSLLTLTPSEPTPRFSNLEGLNVEVASSSRAPTTPGGDDRCKSSSHNRHNLTMKSSQSSLGTSSSSSGHSSRWSLFSGSASTVSDDERLITKRKLVMTTSDDTCQTNPVLESDHTILVPLDFTGNETRVLTDPKEIGELKNLEFERYLHRRYGSLTEEPWFFCKSHEIVESILTKRGTVDGYFLVKPNSDQNTSDINEDPFVLCIVHSDKITYKKISQKTLFKDQVFLLEGINFCFKDVSSLIDFFKLNHLSIMPCLLTEHPIRK